jgi:rhodanese-related sulfurtransferase
VEDRSNSFQGGSRKSWSRLKSVFLEAALVATCGAGLAFAANSLSPIGLSLTRDNFPQRPLVAIPGSLTNSAASETNTADGPEALKARLGAEGLQLADGAETFQLYHDPRYPQELVVFVDARSDGAYQAGHIPGAYQFDRYYPEKYVATMLQVCNPAQQILVYCNGGNCEDSEFAAILLSQWGIPKNKLMVYGGGFTEWTNHHWPVELGTRHSGNLRQY